MRRGRRTQAQNGPMDRDRAFAVLFSEKTFAALWHWLESLGVPMRDRRDVAQDVLLAAFRSFHTYDAMRSRPERWLNKITVHVAAHYRDRAQHRREVISAEPLLEAVDPAPLACEQIEAAQRRRVTFDLVRTLEPELGSVVIAHDIDEIPMADLAEQQGIPVSTAYKRRIRAVEALAAAYRERRADHD